jgi:hypothetical protein
MGGTDRGGSSDPRIHLVESVKFGEGLSAMRSTRSSAANPEPSPRMAGRCRDQTADACNEGSFGEGMVQTTNSKEAAEAVAVRIIPWLQVRILPVLFLSLCRIQ